MYDSMIIEVSDCGDDRCELPPRWLVSMKMGTRQETCSTCLCWTSIQGVGFLSSDVAGYGRGGDFCHWARADNEDGWTNVDQRRSAQLVSYVPIHAKYYLESREVRSKGVFGDVNHPC